MVVLLLLWRDSIIESFCSYGTIKRLMCQVVINTLKKWHHQETYVPGCYKHLEEIGMH
jgi:hypothetical protein